MENDFNKLLKQLKQLENKLDLFMENFEKKDFCIKQSKPNLPVLKNNFLNNFFLKFSNLNFFKKNKISTIIFIEWYKKWMELYKININNTTKSQICGIFQNHILPYIGNKKLNKIESADIQQILNSISHIKRTQTIAYIQLNNCFKKAVDLGLINKNPTTACSIKKHRGNNRRSLDVFEQKKLLDYIKNNKNDFTDIILIYLNTGMRLSELLNITQKDIDRKHYEIHIHGTKTLSSDRVIQTSKNIIDLFPTGNYPFFKFNKDIIERRFRNLTKKLGFKNITIHCLRHTFATNCIENGVDMVVLQKWLGHSSIAMTIDRYTHISHKYKQKQNKKYQAKLPKE